jgi:hypothetical protein
MYLDIEEQIESCFGNHLIRQNLPLNQQRNDDASQGFSFLGRERLQKERTIP